MQDRILKDASKYSLANYFYSILQLFIGIFIRKVLGPLSMGLVSELMLVFDYAKNSHFGILDALDREIPILNGKKDYPAAKKAANVGFTTMFLTGLFITAALIAASFFMQGRYDQRLVAGLRLIAILILPQTVLSLYMVLIRTQHRFDILTRYVVLIAVFDTLIKVFLVIKFGVNGFISAFIATAAAGLAYLFEASRHRFNLQFKSLLKETRRLLAIGLPLLLGGFGFLTLCRIDRFFIIGYLGEKELGYYSIATMFSSYIFLLPNFTFAVIFPRFYEEFGRVRGEIKSLKNYFIKPTLVFAYLFPVCIGLGILILPILLRYILPKFSPGLAPAIILLAGTFSISIINMGQYVLTAVDKQYHLIVIAIVAILASAIFHYLLLNTLKLGLIGVSLAMTGGYLVYTVILLCDAFSHYTKRMNDHLRFLARLYFPMLWALIVLYAVNSFFTYKLLHLSEDLTLFFVKSAIFTLGCLPLIIYVNRETRIVSKAAQLCRAGLMRSNS